MKITNFVVNELIINHSVYVFEGMLFSVHMGTNQSCNMAVHLDYYF